MNRYWNRLLLLLCCLTWSCGDLIAEEKIIADVVYGHKDGLALTFDVFRPTEEANGAGGLFMVSGGWRSSWSPPQRAVGRFRPLLNKGFTVFAVRHGSSPKYNIPEVVADVRRSVRFIRLHAADYKVDPDRLGVYGGSAGGHLSLVLGTTSDDGKSDAGNAWNAPVTVWLLSWPISLRPICVALYRHERTRDFLR
jgi:acetyl esterase/lipase